MSGFFNSSRTSCPGSIAGNGLPSWSGGDADIAAAKKIQAKIGDDFARYGVQ
jgi:hypothetical protein